MILPIRVAKAILLVVLGTSLCVCHAGWTTKRPMPLFSNDGGQNGGACGDFVYMNAAGNGGLSHLNCSLGKTKLGTSSS